MNKLTLEDIKAKVAFVKFTRIGLKTSICLITTINGFEIVGTSSCVDVANFDLVVGENLAYDDAINKLWEVEGYLLQEKLLKEKEKLSNV